MARDFHIAFFTIAGAGIVDLAVGPLDRGFLLFAGVVLLLGQAAVLCVHRWLSR